MLASRENRLHPRDDRRRDLRQPWFSAGNRPEPVSPRDIYVIDGDTIRVRRATFRLVGIDAPEIGETARCEREIEKGYEAKARVVDLVYSRKPLTLEQVACSCSPSAPEGSFLCNYGRRCGILRVADEDVGAILMREGLAKAYAYRWDRPPPKPEWCSPASTDSPPRKPQ